MSGGTATANAPVRSIADIRTLIAPMNARISKSARTMMIVFLAVGLFGALLIVLTKLWVPGLPWDQAITLASTGFLFMGLLPAVVLRWLIRRDLRFAPKLIQHGVLYPAKITSHTRNPVGGMHHVIVEWQADGRALGAHFDMEALEPTISPELSILTRPHSKTVGVILNDQLYLGIRNLRNLLKPRFPKHPV